MLSECLLGSWCLSGHLYIVMALFPTLVRLTCEVGGGGNVDASVKACLLFALRARTVHRAEWLLVLVYYHELETVMQHSGLKSHYSRQYRVALATS